MPIEVIDRAESDYDDMYALSTSSPQKSSWGQWEVTLEGKGLETASEALHKRPSPGKSLEDFIRKKTFEVLHENSSSIKLLSSSCGKSIGGGANGTVDTEGNSEFEVEAHVTVKDDDGNKASAQVKGTLENDDNGNIQGKVSFEVSYEKNFT